MSNPETPGPARIADAVRMRKRWVVVSCWAGSFSTMVPSPTAYRFWTRRGAQRLANRMTIAARDGRWYEVRGVESVAGLGRQIDGPVLVHYDGTPCQNPTCGWGHRPAQSDG